MAQPAPRRASCTGLRAGRAGFTLAEVCVVMIILLVAVNIFCKTIVTTHKMREVTHQNRMAARAVQTVLESMRGEDFVDIYAQFNAHPTDDPDGEWTAPGHLFEVRGLEPLPDAPHASVGEIVFPSLIEEPDKPKSEKDQKKEAEEKAKEREGRITRGGLAFPGPEESNRWWLREDYDDKSLGMPRDLNGDYVIDDEDHGEDYVRLPVCVRVRWQGTSGPRRFQVHTILADYTHRDEKAEKARVKARKEAKKVKKDKK